MRIIVANSSYIMILIYSEKKNKRLQYIFNLVFKDLLGWEFDIITDEENFISSSEPKFSYHFKPIGNIPLICSKELLFESQLNHQEIKFTEVDGIRCPFAVYNDQSLFDFDIFAASFYLISRYEEYLPHKKDFHKRFLASESTAYQNGFLQKPVINIWVSWLEKILRNIYPELPKSTRKYSFTPTYDIDIAWSYKNKGFTRNTGGFIRDLFKMNFVDIKNRYLVLTNRLDDPYDTYDLQNQYVEKYHLKPIYFFLFGKSGPFDKNISNINRQFKVLIKEINDLYNIGIHPSYQSNENSDILKSEIKALQKTVHTEISKSRQHFLKLSLPDTYRNLLNQGIQHDYTMGYAEEPGFRAGICTPFYFYDLDLEVETTLMIHPFTIMDGTLRDYLKSDISSAKEIISKLIEEVKNVNGECISLWHNETLSNKGKWSGWNEVYEHLLKKATS